MRFFNLSFLFVVCALLYVTSHIHAQEEYDDAASHSLVEAETAQLAEDQMYFSAEGEAEAQAEAETETQAEAEAEAENDDNNQSKLQAVDLSHYSPATYSSEEALQHSGFIETAGEAEGEGEAEAEAEGEAEAEAEEQPAARAVDLDNYTPAVYASEEALQLSGFVETAGEAEGEAEAEADAEAEAEAETEVGAEAEAEAEAEVPAASARAVDLSQYAQPLYASEEALQAQGFLEVVHGTLEWKCCRVCPQVHLPSQDQKYGRVPAVNARFSATGVEEGAETGATAENEGEGENENESEDSAESSFIQLLTRSRLVSYADAVSGGCCNICPGPIELADNPNPRADVNGLPPNTAEQNTRDEANSRSVTASSVQAIRFSRSKPTHLPPCCNYCTTGHYSRTPYKQNAGLPAAMKDLPPQAPAKASFLTMREKMADTQAAVDNAVANQCCNQCKHKRNN